MGEQARKYITVAAEHGWDVLSLEIDTLEGRLLGPYREPLIAWVVAEAEGAGDFGVPIGEAVPLTPSMSSSRRVWLFGLQHRENAGQGIIRVWSRKLRGIEMDESRFLERAWAQLNEEWAEVYGETLEESLRRERAAAGGDESRAVDESQPEPAQTPT